MKLIGRQKLLEPHVLPKGISAKGLKLNYRKALARRSNAQNKILGFVSRKSSGRRWNVSEDRISSLLDVLLPVDPLSNAFRELEIANAKERARFITENGCYTAAQLNHMFGRDAVERGELSSRWKERGLIFSVPFRHSELYPAFQFRESLPHPAIAAVLTALPKDMTDWQRAFWFVTPNGWLAGARPADRLSDEAAVVAAAIQESSPIG